MRRISYILLLAISTMMIGCGKSGSGPPTAAVSGTVYMDGKPVPGVEITFLNSDYSVFGVTDSEGRYELVSGAAVGENKVYFSKMTGLKVDLNPDEGMDAGQLMAMSDPGVPKSLRPEQLIPIEYSDPTKSKVSFIVPDGGTEQADFKLQSK